MSPCDNASTITSTMCSNNIIIIWISERNSDKTMSIIPVIVDAIWTRTVAIYSLLDSSKLYFKDFNMSDFSFATPEYSFFVTRLFIYFSLIIFVYLEIVRINRDITVRITVIVINKLR